MYAIIETGGKQYRVEPQESVEIELLDQTVGDVVDFKSVLVVNDGETTHIGKPHVEGASVRGKLIGNVKGEKLISFKFKKRKNQRRKKGHRQQYSRVIISEIAGPQLIP